jgi:hypothetical protein
MAGVRNLVKHCSHVSEWKRVKTSGSGGCRCDPGTAAVWSPYGICDTRTPSVGTVASPAVRVPTARIKDLRAALDNGPLEVT